MRHGRPMSLPVVKIDYKQLRKINPEAARRAALEYLKTTSHNVSQAGLTNRVLPDLSRRTSAVPLSQLSV